MGNANEAVEEAEKTLSNAKSAYSEAKTNYNLVVDSVSYDQGIYDDAYAAQEKAGLALNEANTLYNQTLDSLSVCSM